MTHPWGPRQPRTVVSNERGPWHMPSPGDRPRICAGCHRRIVPYTTKQGARSFRHYWRDRRDA